MRHTYVLAALPWYKHPYATPISSTVSLIKHKLSNIAEVTLHNTQTSSSFMEHFICRQTTTNLWFFSTSGIRNALNYINLMHQIRRIITVAQLHVCRRVLLDVQQNTMRMHHEDTRCVLYVF